MKFMNLRLDISVTSADLIVETKNLRGTAICHFS